MANFDASQTSISAIPNRVTPKAGVTQRPSALPQILDGLFDGVGSILENKKETRKQEFLSEFTNTQLGLIQSAEQGGNSQFARTRIRSNLMQAIQSNPALREDLIKANASILGIAGMGDVVVSGNEEEQRRRAVRDDLVSNGQVAPDASEEEFLEAEENFRKATASKEEFDARMQKIEERKAQVGLSQSELNLLQDQQQFESNKFLSETAPAFIDSFKTGISDITKRLQSGEINEAQAQQEIEVARQQLDEALGPAIANAEPNVAAAYTKTYDQIQEIATKTINGEYEKDAADRELERVIRVQKEIALGDPTFARAVALSELGLPEGYFQGESTVRRKVNDFILGNATETGAPANIFDDDPDATRVYLELFKNQDNLSPEAQQQMGNHLMNVFRGVTTYEQFIADNPEASIPIINEWMASPEFLELRKQYPEMFSNIGPAQEILERNYRDEVWGMVRREFNEAQVGLSASAWSLFAGVMNIGNRGANPNINPDQMQDTNNIVEFNVGASGITFNPVDPDNSAAVAEARRLNKDLAPVINNTVKAFAHLNGDDNYEQYFQEAIPQIMGGDLLGGEGEDQVEGSAGEDTLELEDFQGSIDSIEFANTSVESLPDEVRNDEPFMGEVNRLADKYQIDPSILLGVMDFETGGSFSPSQRNAAGSSATGLIQFMAATARGLGTSTSELAAMSRVEQMQYVERYLDQFADKITGGDAADVYMSILYPRAIGRADSYALFTRGTLAYTQNRGLDRDGNGYVTKAEAAAKVRERVNKYRT